LAGIGVTAAALAGTVTVFELDAPGAIVGGTFLIVARAARPHDTTWFSVEHRRAIELTAGTAWAYLIGAFALMVVSAANRIDCRQRCERRSIRWSTDDLWHIIAIG